MLSATKCMYVLILCDKSKENKTDCASDKIHSEHKGPLTSVHDQIPSDFGLPVIPGGFESLGKADAEVLEVAFAHEGLGGAGSDQCALNGQDQSWAGVKIYAVVGLTMGKERS